MPRIQYREWRRTSHIFGYGTQLIATLDTLGVVFTPYAWLGHILLGLGIQAFVAVPLQLGRVRAAWWLGAAVSAGFWWGRKKVEYEFALKAAAGLHTLGPFWWRGWLPFDWGAKAAWEFLAPALASLLVAWLVGRRLRVTPGGKPATR